MRASDQDLEQLIELQRIIFAQRKLLAQAQELSKGGVLEQLRLQLADLSESLSALRLENEELRRELKRQESDLELVEKRLKQDAERLNQSSNPKDITGIQHEIETLRKRKSDLEDLELEIMEQIESSDQKLHQTEIARDSKETEIEQARQQISIELAELKSENQDLSGQAEQIRKALNPDLVVLFDAKLSRGVAVGRLNGSSCSACNMSLNSQAMAEVAKVPSGEIANCPECSAILVRA